MIDVTVIKAGAVGQKFDSVQNEDELLLIIDGKVFRSSSSIPIGFIRNPSFIGSPIAEYNISLDTDLEVVLTEANKALLKELFLSHRLVSILDVTRTLGVSRDIARDVLYYFIELGFVQKYETSFRPVREYVNQM